VRNVEFKIHVGQHERKLKFLLKAWRASKTTQRTKKKAKKRQTWKMHWIDLIPRVWGLFSISWGIGGGEISCLLFESGRDIIGARVKSKHKNSLRKEEGYLSSAWLWVSQGRKEASHFLKTKHNWPLLWRRNFTWQCVLHIHEQLFAGASHGYKVPSTYT
jgi:hypothetical protein